MTETIEKTQDQKERQEKLEKMFDQNVVNFKQRWANKGTNISQAGLHNYAMSTMRYEFHNKFDKDTATRLVEKYKP